ncbi:MAG: beta-ketoacyl-[acyl-carrier-protein] synthase II [Flavobacteriaceae bacterium]|nr:beta-ketoacyl-[acyl-carrier-protein] synthase II [Flavobacteriaceae bacterium]PHX76905.1 MAG: beta-ketoacyl-[acyl-carrier-protein] synthase II [Flavobacteriales bacterium]
MQLRRVVITGLGAITPLGNDVNSFFNGLRKGVSGAGLITHFDTEKFKVKFACEVKNFNTEDFFDRKEARKMDPFTQYAMVAADEAIHHSGILQQTYNPDRIGVVWGAGIGGLSTFFSEIVDYARGDGTPRFSPFFIPKMIVDIAPGYISIKHGFRGPNYCTVSACASSTHSMIDAFNLIRLGKADAIVAGGSEASVNEPSVGGFSNMKALSERNDDFMTASRPFDKDRDGFVMGEGAAAMIVEDYEHAKARGAKIYAEIVGGGMTADAYHLTAPHPEGLGACNVMKVALEDAGMVPSDIDYINVHGTSTPLGDIAESKAILSVFGKDAYNLNISSTKSMTGHLLGGAGAIESLACILAVSEDIIPPTINHFTDDPEFDPNLNFTFNVAQKRTVRAALSNTFGFGGHNGSVIFKKFED